MDANKQKKLMELNVNDMTEERQGLTYLSWSKAWKEFLKVYPDATYEISHFDFGRPYMYDTNTGYMVETSVTADGVTRVMWLPVLDSANNPMKDEPYTFKTKYGKEKYVSACTMFDVNKAIMRCLTKNLAMFGLGLYIYNGEDLPEVTPADDDYKWIKDALYQTNSNVDAFLRTFNVKSVDEMDMKSVNRAKQMLRVKLEREKKHEKQAVSAEAHEAGRTEEEEK